MGCVKHQKSNEDSKPNPFQAADDRIDSIRLLRDRSIDRRPAWIVAFIVFLIISMHYGILNCGAMFFSDMEEEFGKPVSVIAWSVTGQMAVTMSLAPFYNRLLDFVPGRVATICAVLLSSVSLISSAFSPNFWVFLVTYTFFTGFGLGASFVRLYSVLAQYFEKYRIMSLAIGSSGAGFGTLIYVKLGTFLIETYTWRVALIGLGLFHLHIIPLSLLMRQLPPEPPSEPAIILPTGTQLDLTDISQLLQPGKDLEPSGVAQFMSSMSVASRMSTTSRRAGQTSAVPRIIAGEDLQVVIEFVRVSRDSSHPGRFIIDSIQFMNDPGPRVIRMIEDSATKILTDQEPSLQSTIIPLIFFTCDLGTYLGGQAPESGPTPFTTSQWADLDRSRQDIGGELPGQTEQEPIEKSHPLLFGSSIGSLVLTTHDIRQSYQGVRAAVKRAEEKVDQLIEHFKPESGVAIYPKPIRVLIDQSDYFAKTKLSSHDETDDRLHILGYQGPTDDPIPEEDEPAEVSHRPMSQSSSRPTDSRRELEPIEEYGTGVSAGTSKPKPRPITYHAHGSTTGLTHSTVSFGDPGSPGHHSKWQSGSIFHSSSMLPIRIADRKTSVAYYRSKDITTRTSVVCADTADEAVGLLLSKLETEIKETSPEEALRTVSKTTRPRFILANPVFLTFLLYRSCTYMTDSCMFSHILNFSLSVGYSPDQTTTILSLMGLASMFGRLLIGVVGQFVKGIEIRMVSAIATMLVGVNLIGLPFTRHFLLTCLAAIFYGFGSGPNFAFSPAIALQSVSPEQVEQAISFVLQFEALGYLIGGPISGILNDSIGGYAPGFIFGAVVELTGAIIIMCHAIRYWKINRRDAVVDVFEISDHPSCCYRLCPCCCRSKAGALDDDYAFDDIYEDSVDLNDVDEEGDTGGNYGQYDTVDNRGEAKAISNV